MLREKFFEELDNFDFDSFGKDDNFDNSDVYQVIQFFVNKIFDNRKYEVCENCILFSMATGEFPDGFTWERYKCKAYIFNDDSNIDYTKMSCDEFRRR